MLACPRQQTKPTEVTELVRVRHLGTSTDDHDAPALVIGGVKLIHLKGHRGATHALVDITTSPRAKQDAMVQHGEVDRQDQGAAAHGTADPTHTSSLEQLQTLNGTQYLQILEGFEPAHAIS